MSFGPDSTIFLALLLASFAACAAVVARSYKVVVQVGAASLAFALASTFGIALVNRYYAYYDSWGSLLDASSGAGTVSVASVRSLGPHRLAAVAPSARAAGLAKAAPAAVAPKAHPSPASSKLPGKAPASVPLPPFPPRQPDRRGGSVVALTLAGSVNGITRSGYVYLPPQYSEPAYRDAVFPVVELLHGDPGNAAGWLYGIHLRQTMDQLIGAGTIGPVIVVMPSTFTGAHGQECMNAAPGGLQDDTYLTTDVPADVVANFRVAPPGPAWGIAGLSDGGFCAANLSLRHPQVFGAAGVMDGYFTPLHPQRTVRRLFAGDASQLAANDPLQRVVDNAVTLPHFWIMAGTNDHADYAAAEQFGALLAAREPSYLLTVVGGKHTTPAWRTSLPSLMEWMWPTLTGGNSPAGSASEQVSR